MFKALSYTEEEDATIAVFLGGDEKVLHRRSNVKERKAAIYMIFYGFTRYSHLRSIGLGIKHEQSTKQPLRMADPTLNKCIDLPASEMQI